MKAVYLTSPRWLLIWWLCLISCAAALPLPVGSSSGTSIASSPLKLPAPSVASRQPPHEQRSPDAKSSSPQHLAQPSTQAASVSHPPSPLEKSELPKLTFTPAGEKVFAQVQRQTEARNRLPPLPAYPSPPSGVTDGTAQHPSQVSANSPSTSSAQDRVDPQIAPNSTNPRQTAIPPPPVPDPAIIARQNRAARIEQVAERARSTGGFLGCAAGFLCSALSRAHAPEASSIQHRAAGVLGGTWSGIMAANLVPPVTGLSRMEGRVYNHHVIPAAAWGGAVGGQLEAMRHEGVDTMGKSAQHFVDILD